MSCTQCAAVYLRMTSFVKLFFQELKKKFFDTLRIYVRGGGGGQGFPKYGGVGGNGGNVILVSKKKKFLKDIKDAFPNKRFIAGTGKNSR